MASRSSAVYSNNASTGVMSNNHFYGNIVLGDASAVKEMFNQLNQDGLNSSMGLTANAGVSR
jgi:hypothetical protein